MKTFLTLRWLSSFVFLTGSAVAVTVTPTGELNYSYTESFYGNKPETISKALQGSRVSDEQKGRLIVRILIDGSMPQSLRKVVLDPDLARTQPALIPYVLGTLYGTGDVELYRYIRKPVIIPAATEFLFAEDQVTGLLVEIGKLITTKGALKRGQVFDRQFNYVIKWPFPRIFYIGSAQRHSPQDELNRTFGVAFLQYFRELTEAIATFDFSLRSESFRNAAERVRFLFSSDKNRLLLHTAFDEVYGTKSDEEFDRYMHTVSNWGKGLPPCTQLPELK